jgi:hypothetical protein
MGMMQALEAKTEEEEEEEDVTMGMGGSDHSQE